MIAIIDYGVGNLFSLTCSFKAIGADTVVTGDPEIIKKADKLILPGVGAFSDAIKKLKKASVMDIPEKEEAIRNIKNEIEEQKNKNSPSLQVAKLYSM